MFKIPEKLLELSKRPNVWVCEVNLVGVTGAYPEIGMDGCAFIKHTDQYGNSSTKFYALITAPNKEEAMRLGKIKFLAAAAAFAYNNALPHIIYPEYWGEPAFSAVSLKEYLEKISDDKWRGDLNFLSRELSESEIHQDLHYGRLVDTYKIIESGDAYTMQAASYLARAYWISRDNPSEAVTSFYKLFELLNRKLNSGSGGPPKLSDERINEIIALSRLNQAICSHLIKFRDVRNFLIAHGIVEPETSVLLGVYSANTDIERELIKQYGDITTALIRYSFVAQILARKIFSVIVGLPFYLLDYPRDMGADKELVESTALDSKEQPHPVWRGVVCAGDEMRLSGSDEVKFVES